MAANVTLTAGWLIEFLYKLGFGRISSVLSEKIQKMATVEELQKKVKELEAKLAATKENDGPVRQKIEVMSSEVVDSNPYRYLGILYY